MGRYIDADLLKNRISEHKRIAIHKDDIARIISDIPTADVEKVKHGQWVTLGDSEMCSACTGTKLKEFDTAYGKAMWVESKYCPNCGAKMDL